jgi:hypothetical protein
MKENPHKMTAHNAAQDKIHFPSSFDQVLFIIKKRNFHTKNIDIFENL